MLTTQTYFSKQAGTNGQWVSIPGAVIPLGGHASSSPTKKYRLKVRTDDTRSNSWGVNVFSVRLAPVIPGWGAIDVRCTTVNTAPGCPTIYAENYMSIWVNAAGSTADLYLAQIASIHAGKRVRIDLWDPGEGSRALKILAPTGAGTWGPTSFTWRTEPCPGSPCGSPYAGTANSGNNYELPLGNPCLVPGEPNYMSYSQPGARAGRCLFNDRHVIIELDIPLNYTAANGGWWRFQYLTSGGGARVTDRTTWQIRVEGDPVHLVDE